MYFQNTTGQLEHWVRFMIRVNDKDKCSFRQDEAMAKEKKFRHEFKYLVTEAQLEILRVRLMGLMQKDTHVGKNGTYHIKSLYFDDINNRCYYENENGVAPREKFRIRIYNHEADRISLECKRKENDKIYKSSCILDMEQYEYLALDKGHIDLVELPPLAQKLQLLKMISCMKAKVIVSYERTPYVYRNGNVRITFDRNISSSDQIEDFFSKNIRRRVLLPKDVQLLEVKYDEYLPDHIYRALQMDRLQRTNFSKYYLCRKYGFEVM